MANSQHAVQDGYEISSPLDTLTKVSLKEVHVSNLLKPAYVNTTITSSGSNFSSAGTLANSTSSARIFDESLHKTELADSGSTLAHDTTLHIPCESLLSIYC